MTSGTVKWFNTKKGYGFITPVEGSEPEGPSSDVFVHHSAIQVEGDEFRSLNEGDEVEFEISQGVKGPEAKQVKVTKKAPPPPPRERIDRNETRLNFGYDYRPQRNGRDGDRRNNRRGFRRGGANRRGTRRY